MAAADNEFLKIAGISKKYGVVTALSNVSFSIRRGEIHAVLGENGAGKSTLVKIIMGEETPDEGSIELDGIPVREYTPLNARSMGIQMVHQEQAVFENMTVAENIFPWHGFKTKIGTVNWKKLNDEAQKKLGLFEITSIKPEQTMSTVNLAGQQIIEILRCIAAEPKIIILDEPTSGINDDESSRLMKILKQLRDDGHTIIYISHRLKEIIELTDRVTVLRDGQYICTLVNDKNLTEDVLINNMVGRDLSGSLYKRKIYNTEQSSEVLFEARNFSKKNALDDASFLLRKGEILGVFGLEGSGTDKLSRMMYGLESRGSGEIYFKNEKISNINPTEMVKRRIVYLNNNRKQAGLLLDMAVSDNISMPILKKISRLSLIDYKKLYGITEQFIKLFSVVIPSCFTKPRNLSGGNQQKIMLSICLAAEPELIVVNEPTRGIDVGAKAEIHKFILDIAQKGVGVILFSSELPELMSLADRILVLRNRAIVGEVSGQDISDHYIMSLAAVDERAREVRKN